MPKQSPLEKVSLATTLLGVGLSVFGLVILHLGWKSPLVMTGWVIALVGPMVAGILIFMRDRRELREAQAKYEKVKAEVERTRRSPRPEPQEPRKG